MAIKHAYTGDLKIDLVTPGGKTIPLKQAGGIGSVDLSTSYTVDTSAENRTGAWKLQVQDVYQYDSGTIDSFGVSF